MVDVICDFEVNDLIDYDICDMFEGVMEIVEMCVCDIMILCL